MRAAEVNPPLQELPTPQPPRPRKKVAAAPPVGMGRGWRAFNPLDYWRMAGINNWSPERMQAEFADDPWGMLRATAGNHLGQQFSSENVASAGRFVSSLPQLWQFSQSKASPWLSRLPEWASGLTTAAQGLTKHLPAMPQALQGPALKQTGHGIVKAVPAIQKAIGGARAFGTAAATDVGALGVAASRYPAIGRAAQAAGAAAKAIPGVARVAPAAGLVGRTLSGPAAGVATIGLGLKDAWQLATGQDSLDGGNMPLRAAEVASARKVLDSYNTVYPQGAELRNQQFQAYTQSRLKPSFAQRTTPGLNGTSYLGAVGEGMGSPLKSVLQLPKSMVETPATWAKALWGNHKMQQRYKGSGPLPKWVTN